MTHACATIAAQSEAIECYPLKVQALVIGTDVFL